MTHSTMMSRAVKNSPSDVLTRRAYAEQVAFASTLNGNGNACIVDVSRACALRNLQRSKHRGVKQVHLAEIFGTLVIGQ